jgi:hypothetical protein
VAVLVVACGDPPSPEDQIRARINEAVGKAFDRDVVTLRSYMSETYLDDRYQNKEGMGRILAFYLKQPGHLFFLSRIKTIEIAEPGKGNVVMLLAFANKPIPGPEKLVEMSADVFRIDLGMLEEEGDWRVARAAWRRIKPEDFL